jgi:hypothetical protein
MVINLQAIFREGSLDLRLAATDSGRSARGEAHRLLNAAHPLEHGVE